MFETLKISWAAWKDAMFIANSARKGRTIETREDGTYVVIVEGDIEMRVHTRTFIFLYF